MAVFITSLLLSRRIILLGDISFDGLWRNLTISLITILIWGAISFQRPIAGLLILLPPVFGAAVATGVLGILHTRISNTDLALGLALICMSINYGITALHRIPSSHATWARSLQSPMVIVPTATVAVLLCNWFSDYRQIGLFAAVGLSAAAGFAGLVLPAHLTAGGEATMAKSPRTIGRSPASCGHRSPANRDQYCDANSRRIGRNSDSTRNSFGSCGTGDGRDDANSAERCVGTGHIWAGRNRDQSNQRRMHPVSSRHSYRLQREHPLRPTGGVPRPKKQCPRDSQSVFPACGVRRWHRCFSQACGPPESWA